MRTVPFDSTIAFLREGYPFISSRCDALGMDLFTSRLGLRPVTFVRGAEAAEMFYARDRFTRVGVLPPSMRHLLQDACSVHTLEEDAHRHRKAAVLSLMTPAAMARLGDLFETQWHTTGQRWAGQQPIVLHDQAREILTRTACAWAGIPLPEHQVRRRTREFGLMIDNAPRFGPPNWYARVRRRVTDRWAAQIIDGLRAGDLDAPEGTAAHVFAAYRDLNGELLSPDVAAGELLTILRPTVAVARFIVFAAVALHEHPAWRDAFAAGNETDLEPFVQEVRRYYPFFPAVPGRARESFEWRGRRFGVGDWVMLDLYGTCHDARLWENPYSFAPERFRGWSWEENPYTLIAQGAGQHAETHRCPGEWSTVELLIRATRLLATTGFQVPVQDLSIPLDHFPALPKSGFVLTRP